MTANIDNRKKKITNSPDVTIERRQSIKTRENKRPKG